MIFMHLAFLVLLLYMGGHIDTLPLTLLSVFCVI